MRVLLAAALLLLATAPAGAQTPARPAQPGTLTLAYDGVLLVKVLDMRLEERVQPGTYAAFARVKSFGVLSLFKKLDVEASADGRLDGGAAQPIVFRHANRDGHANRSVEVRWTGQDVATRVSVPYPTIGDPLPTREQKLAAADPLTQLTRIALTSATRHPCEDDLDFFDGRQL